MAENKKTAAKTAKPKTKTAAEAAAEMETKVGADDLEALLANAVPEYDQNMPVETLLAIAAQVGLDGAEDTVKAYLIKLLDDFFDGMTEAEDYPPVEAFANAQTAYNKAKEDIRAITQGENDTHRPMTWREATALWEKKHPAKKNERHRAAFFAALGIATPSECALLSGHGDIS